MATLPTGPWQRSDREVELLYYAHLLWRSRLMWAGFALALGISGVGFGLSLGTTWHDEDCERRHDAVTLHNLGAKEAAGHRGVDQIPRRQQVHHARAVAEGRDLARWK